MSHPLPDGTGHGLEGRAFARLVQLVATLRGADGCPWDRAQTRASVAPYLVEETYEVMDAIADGDPLELKEELGVLMFQVLFHADLARGDGEFDITQVRDTLCDKMVHRDPHVYGDAEAGDAETVLENWDKLKAAEPNKAARKSVLDGVPRSLPALLRATKVSKKAAKAGFDWVRAEDVWHKVHEEIDELKEALAAGDTAAARDELGDVMFALVNLGRKMNLPPEEALTGTIERFRTRFAHMERHAPCELEALSAERWQDLWAAAKAEERRRA